jgi:response regulator of citrate/malate metabolism
VTARRYLEHLAVEGVVDLSMRYGGTGPPEHYAWPGEAGPGVRRGR